MITLTSNQTQYSVIALISLVITLIGLLLTMSVYRSTRSRPVLLLIAIHVLLFPYYIFHTFLYTVGKFDVEFTILLYRLSVILITLISFLLVLFIESLRSEKLSTIIVMLVTFGTGISIIVSVFPGTFLWDPEIGPFFADFSRSIYVVELFLLTL
ncbi:MAG: hypothetical protein ACFE95_08360, partial [Candidatus Hodarchaeota archaeon]